MRKTLTALLFAAALPTLAIAAPDTGTDAPHDMHDMHGMHSDGPRGGHMMHELNLTPEQRQKVGTAMREQMKTRHEILQRYLDKLPAADKAAMKKELDANRDKQQKVIRDTLTPEQQKKFDEMQKNMEKRRAEQAEPAKKAQ